MSHLSILHIVVYSFVFHLLASLTLSLSIVVLFFIFFLAIFSCLLFFLSSIFILLYFFFFQSEYGIRDIGVTVVQTCALPISFFFQAEDGIRDIGVTGFRRVLFRSQLLVAQARRARARGRGRGRDGVRGGADEAAATGRTAEIGRASCRERV